MQRKHFLYVMIAALLLPPLAVTGRLSLGEALAQALSGGPAASATPDIRVTRHNLSSSALSRQATSGNALTTEPIVFAAAGVANNEVCVYCHTPHGADTTAPGTPLWNRPLSAAVYTGYSSASLQAADLDVTAVALAAPSKLCLSCHDGTLALGMVANAPGYGGANSALALANTDAGALPSTTGRMPFGRGQANALHGFSRNLGADLRNDHPISFTYNAALATADGELRTPLSPLIANRVTGSPKPTFPLTGNKVQCTTCHDPHKPTQKFLNTNRLARVAPEAAQTSYADWTFNADNDQICLGCHTRLGKAWAVSAHANSLVANETYVAGAAAMRDFPTTPATTVWQAGCLNCHDPHTVSGSRRLLREGVSGTPVASTVPGIGYVANLLGGGAAANYNQTSALENTCYQCHSPNANSVITPTVLSATEGVPDIQTEFGRTYHMPITNGEQGASGAGNTTENHDISNKDLAETQAQLGLAAPQNRHVECSDCHNPHRVVKADTFLGGNLVGGDTTRRSHVPARGTTGNEGNIASGALRGSWGVEPSYTASGQTTVTSTTIWMSTVENPTFTVKTGDPGAAALLPVGTAGTNAATHLTREYQLCFKCHSNYANGPLATDFPLLKAALGRGGTATATNTMTRYTDVAKEFAVLATDPPTTGTHQGEATNVGTACGGGNCTPVGSSWDTLSTNAATVNHRSWHPVVFPTGRDGLERGNAAFANIKTPFATAAKIGRQTMHCSDCHGNATSWTDGTGPSLTQVQGPHGSANPFLLKGTWTSTTSLGSFTGSLCENCHVISGATNSGLNGNHVPDGNMSGARCMRCHIAVPHGWKNKAFLVNKRCVGTEGGEIGNCSNLSNFLADLNRAPYYVTARNAFLQWVPSRSSGYTNEGATCNDPGGNMKDCAIP